MAFLGGPVERQQHPFPGLMARLPHKGEGWEAPGSEKAEVMKESVMIG